MPSVAALKRELERLERRLKSRTAKIPLDRMHQRLEQATANFLHIDSRNLRGLREHTWRCEAKVMRCINDISHHHRIVASIRRRIAAIQVKLEEVDPDD